MSPFLTKKNPPRRIYFFHVTREDIYFFAFIFNWDACFRTEYYAFNQNAVCVRQVTCRQDSDSSSHLDKRSTQHHVCSNSRFDLQNPRRFTVVFESSTASYFVYITVVLSQPTVLFTEAGLYLDADWLSSYVHIGLKCILTQRFTSKHNCSDIAICAWRLCMCRFFCFFFSLQKMICYTFVKTVQTEKKKKKHSRCKAKETYSCRGTEQSTGPF